MIMIIITREHAEHIPILFVVPSPHPNRHHLHRHRRIRIVDVVEDAVESRQ